MKERWETLCFGDSAKQQSHPVSLHNSQCLGESSATLPSVMTRYPWRVSACGIGKHHTASRLRRWWAAANYAPRTCNLDEVRGNWVSIWDKKSFPAVLIVCQPTESLERKGGGVWGKQQTEEQNFKASTDKKTKKLSLKTNKPKKVSGGVGDTQEAQTSRVKSLRCLLSARNYERLSQNGGNEGNFCSVD